MEKQKHISKLIYLSKDQKNLLKKAGELSNRENVTHIAYYTSKGQEIPGKETRKKDVVSYVVDPEKNKHHDSYDKMKNLYTINTKGKKVAEANYHTTDSDVKENLELDYIGTNTYKHTGIASNNLRILEKIGGLEGKQNVTLESLKRYAPTFDEQGNQIYDKNGAVFIDKNHELYKRNGYTDSGAKRKERNTIPMIKPITEKAKNQIISGFEPGNPNPHFSKAKTATKKVTKVERKPILPHPEKFL